MAELVFGWRELVVGVRHQSRAEYHCEVLCSHQVFVGFARKDAEEVEDVEKEVLVCVCHRVDEPLVCRDDRLLIVRLFCNGFSERKIKVIWYHGLGHMSEVASEDTRDIMCRVILRFPIE